MPTTLADSEVPLARDHDVALLDLDGVVYVGPQAVPGAADHDPSIPTARSVSSDPRDPSGLIR